MCGAGMGTTKKEVWRREVAEKLGVLGGVACVEGFGDGMGMGMGMKVRFSRQYLYEEYAYLS